MKDIKTLMIGFLLATCMFLLMGQGSSKSDVGKYQAFGFEGEEFSQLYMIDTNTGELYTATDYKYKGREKWRRKSPKTDWFKD